MTKYQEEKAEPLLLVAINNNIDKKIETVTLDKIIQELFENGYKIYPINFKDDSSYIKVC